MRRRTFVLLRSRSAAMAAVGVGRSRLPAAVALVAGAAILLVAALVAAPPKARAATATINLATAGDYSVLAGATVTNIGSSVLDASLGLSPGTDVTGFPPGTVTAPGVTHIADAVALQAKGDLDTAFTDASGRAPTANVTVELGGKRLIPGVYVNNTLGLTGTVTLDAKGDPGAVFIFRAATTLITGSASRVALVNGTDACHVFWRVGSSATLGTSSIFAGTIMADQSVTVNTGVTVHGRALARIAAVTLDSDTFTSPVCNVAAANAAASTYRASVAAASAAAASSAAAAASSAAASRSLASLRATPPGGGTTVVGGGGAATGSPTIGGLPNTGISAVGPLWLAGLLLISGGAVVALSRGRRRQGGHR